MARRARARAWRPGAGGAGAEATVCCSESASMAGWLLAERGSGQRCAHSSSAAARTGCTSSRHRAGPLLAQGQGRQQTIYAAEQRHSWRSDSSAHPALVDEEERRREGTTPR